MYGIPPSTYVEVKEDSAKFKMDILQSMTSMLGFLGLILDLSDADKPVKRQNRLVETRGSLSPW